MLEKGADRGTPEACFGEKPIECAKHATTATGGEGDIESSPEHHGTLNAVTVDVGKDSGLGPGRIERAHSSTSTCSDTTADRGSGVSTAACDGDGSLAAVCLSPVDSCSFYGGDDPAAGVGDDSTTCSVAAVLKRQALLTIVECQRTLQTDGVRLQTHASIVLHFAALLLSFVMLVSLWGILDVAVENMAGSSCIAKFKWYSVLLAAGIFMTVILKLFEIRGYACAAYPTLFSSLVTIVAAWGILDSLVEMAAGGSKRFEGILYLLFFIVAALLVFLHTCFCDRSFSMQLHRFICY